MLTILTYIVVIQYATGGLVQRQQWKKNNNKSTKKKKNNPETYETKTQTFELTEKLVDRITQHLEDQPQIKKKMGNWATELDNNKLILIELKKKIIDLERETS